VGLLYFVRFLKFWGVVALFGLSENVGKGKNFKKF
jgi:hypothetical protein